LRLASNTVELINRLPTESRDSHFERIAQALIQSTERDVARYGKTLLVGGGKTGPAVGEPLELKCTTVDGQRLELKSFREDVVLIEFWATWCGPCRKLQPAMVSLLEKHPDVKLISICLDADHDGLDEYLAENHAPGYLVFGDDAQQSAKSFGVRSIPTIFIVDQQSRLHHIARNADHLSEIIQKLAPKNGG
jgi:thiol-disulfide isomerase/thioredoxin